jgi:serine/threonine-protein kinase
MPLEAQQDALIGSVLEGRFQIERLLGEGGMGRVYVADELRLRRRCALKVLLPELSEDPACVERFLREAQAIAQIRHENVVEIYHLGENQGSGVVFFAMELLVGKDLETRLLERARAPLSWQQIVRWMEQVASAMAAVHAAGMIHRDLKPSNIFIAQRRGRDHVKLLDFGIAKIASHAALTSTGAAIGTPYYMSPEQILAQPLDARTDIYSFGALFFEALAGRMPFVGEPLQVAMQHCNVPMPRIADVAPDAGVPPELEALIQRMLVKDREARIQTMEEIEAFLHDFLISHNAATVDSISTGPLPVARSALIDSSLLNSGAISQQRTLLAGSTPPPGLLDIQRLDEPPRPATRPLVPLLAGVTVLGVLVVLTVLLLGRGDDPTPPATPSVPVAGVAPPLPSDPPPVPAKVPPVPTPDPRDATTAPADPVPSDSPPEDPGKPRKPSTPKTTDKTPDKPADKPGDPLRQIRKAADACRKTHKAVKGPAITIDYAIGSDGVVTRAVPTLKDALGACLADAVKAAKFAPQLKLGLKIDL